MMDVYGRKRIKPVIGPEFIFPVLLVFLLLAACTTEKTDITDWPEHNSQNRPWTRWWWMGNAVDREGISYQLEAFRDAGLGGVEITPIFGVKGYEDNFIDYLSEEWLDMLDYTLEEAARLGLGVDMNLGTGWPFGGPQTEIEFAASKISIRKYQLSSGKLFSEKLFPEGQEQSACCKVLKLYSFDPSGEKTDLTAMLNDNQISFSPESDIDLYAVFLLPTGQQVKRAAPGGEGNVLDHFSSRAFDDYVLAYTEMSKMTRKRMRAVFNDSYEVYNADFTSSFLEEFSKRRKYDLCEYLPLLYEKPATEMYRRVLSDYRETLADLISNDFAARWNEWSNRNGYITKYQAHGSPGNLVDLYASADIPECEVFGSPEYEIPGYRRDTTGIRKGDFDKLMIRFCSSAAHLKGDKLVSSETFTWLREHFKTSLSHCKPVAEDMFLGGINHIFLHGSTYSPPGDPWPGWKFYASVNFNPNNAIWKDSKYLFDYISNCQSVLQAAEPDNGVLIYWPVHDSYAEVNPENLLHQFSIHNIDEWLLGTSFYKLASELDDDGIGFDFISDAFILKAEARDKQIIIDGKSSYKAIVIPELERIPVETLKALVKLKKEGANVIFCNIPEKVPGLYEHSEREKALDSLVNENRKLFAGDRDVREELKSCGIRGETLSNYGLRFIRKKLDEKNIYFVVNHSSETIDNYLPFNYGSGSVLLMDPMTRNRGLAKIRQDGNSTEVKLYLEPGQSVFVVMETSTTNIPTWNYPVFSTRVIIPGESWKLEFLEGGPELPETVELEHPVSWTDLGPHYEEFSGTARYSTTFRMDSVDADDFILDLGDLRESARVYLNGEFMGALFSLPFRISIGNKIREGDNLLEIEVTNLSANRIRALELEGKEWKKFYEINMVNIHYLPFKASDWSVQASGILSGVKIIPVSFE